MHDMHMEEATRDDAPGLAQLYEWAQLNAQGECSSSEAAFAAWDRMHQALPGARVLVAKRCDGTVVAALTLLILPTVAHSGTPSAVVEDVAVHPLMQRSGLGRRMVQRAMAIAREAGCYKLALSSHNDREGAHAFYERLGFERQGVSFGVTLSEALQTA
jgi:GNAT superfamily N-acetyltransferase